MKEFFDAYEHLKSYPEFDLIAITKKYKVWEEHDGNSGDGEHVAPPWVFDPKLAFEYVMLAYAEDSSLAKITDLPTRKLNAMKSSKIPEEQREKILKNENPMVGDMITRLFRHINNIDYELLISGKEAIVTLLEVVRKPIDSRLLDDKERNAVKAKRECFEDAQVLFIEIKKIYNAINEINGDMGAYVKEAVFKGGNAERLAGKTKKN